MTPNKLLEVIPTPYSVANEVALAGRQTLNMTHRACAKRKRLAALMSGLSALVYLRIFRDYLLRRLRYQNEVLLRAGVFPSHT